LGRPVTRRDVAARPTSPPGQVTPRAGETFDELFLRERQPMVRVAYLIADRPPRMTTDCVMGD